MHTVTVTRGYKDGDQWKDSHSFGYDELTIVAKLMYGAHSYIIQRRAQARASKGEQQRCCQRDQTRDPPQ